MISKDIYFILYPNYIPIKGKYKCILADVSKGEYFEIPNLVYEILHVNKVNSFNLDELNNYFDNRYKSGIQGYFELFTKKRIGFLSNTNQNLANISYDYKSPFIITNAIIEFDTKVKYHISTLIKFLANAGCQEIEIRVLSYDALLLILKILKEFQSSTIRSFYLICQSKIETNILNLADELNNNLKINQLKVFNSENNLNDSSNKIVRIKQSYVEDSGFTSLIINPVYFYESQHFNASLNQKIAIDKNGNVKNYISHKKIFGNVNYQMIEDIIRNKEFTKIWNITNDKIEICKECQYRYFCLNFSELVEKNGKFYKRNYCNKLFLN